MIDALKIDIQALMAEYQGAVQSMGAEISILKKAVAQSPSTMSGPPQKERVLEPKGFRGARNARIGKFPMGHGAVLQGYSCAQ